MDQFSSIKELMDTLLQYQCLLAESPYQQLPPTQNFFLLIMNQLQLVEEAQSSF